MKDSWQLADKAPQRTSIQLRSVAAGELGRLKIDILVKLSKNEKSKIKQEKQRISVKYGHLRSIPIRTDMDLYQKSQFYGHTLNSPGDTQEDLT